MKPIKNNLDSILIFLFALCFYLLSEKLDIFSDIELHANHITRINSNESFYDGNFLLYLLVNTLSGFSNTINTLILVYSIVLSAFITLKYWCAKQFLYPYFSQKNVLGSILTASLLFVFAIPDFYILFDQILYIGKIVANVWHNPTTIALMPFAILLFMKQIQVLGKDSISTKDIISITLLILLNLFIKPSYFLVYLPVTGLFILLKYQTVKQSLKLSTPLIIGVFVLVLQYYIIYVLRTGQQQVVDSHVALSTPFKALSFHLPYWYIPFMLISSLLFPLYFIFKLSGNKLKHIFTQIRNNQHLDFYFATVTLLAALFLFIFVRETGARERDLNFSWQNVPALFITFMVYLKYLLLEVDLSQPWRKWTLKVKIAILFYGLHVASGFLYLFKYLFFRSYA